MPDHLFFSSIPSCSVFGASVNRRNARPLNDVAEIIENFTEVDLIVTGDVAGVSSTILDLTTRPGSLIRGAPLPEAIRQVLQ